MLLDYAETDWLGSRPVFYNIRTGAISYNMNEVIDYSNFAFHPEGLRNYLSFGYTAMGQTMVRDVKALRWDATIRKDGDGRLIIAEYPDSVERFYGKNIKSGREVFSEVRQDIARFAERAPDKIVLPLSGGLDSRLLALGCSEGGVDKTYAFSYGISARQYDSFEVVKASIVAEKCGIKWQHIPLTHYYDMLDKWYRIYGPSVHLHGMYQMEFYERVKERFTPEDKLTLCSGIIGDGWSGNVRIAAINSPYELSGLGYTHGACIEDDVCLLKGNHDIAESFYEENKDKLKEENWRIIYAMRFKIMLLHYLLHTPRSMGMDVYSPFIKEEIAMDIVNLSWEEKTGRKWEHECFQEEGMDYGWLKMRCDYNICVNMNVMRDTPLPPLNVNLLRQVIEPSYVESVNRLVSKKPWKGIPAKPRTVRNMYNKVVNRRNSPINDAVVKYEILAVIQKLLENMEEYNGYQRKNMVLCGSSETY